MEAGNGAGDLPFEATVVISRVGTTASVDHTAHGMSSGDKVAIRGCDLHQYNGVFPITNVTTNAYDYIMNATPDASPATGSPEATARTATSRRDVAAEEGSFTELNDCNMQ